MTSWAVQKKLTIHTRDRNSETVHLLAEHVFSRDAMALDLCNGAFTTSLTRLDSVGACPEF